MSTGRSSPVKTIPHGSGKSGLRKHTPKSTRPQPKNRRYRHGLSTKWAVGGASHWRNHKIIKREPVVALAAMYSASFMFPVRGRAPNGRRHCSTSFLQRLQYQRSGSSIGCNISSIPRHWAFTGQFVAAKGHWISDHRQRRCTESQEKRRATEKQALGTIVRPAQHRLSVSPALPLAPPILIVFFCPVRLTLQQTRHRFSTG